MTPRDWPGGEYYNSSCVNCQHSFIGPKRAPTCFDCYSKIPADVAAIEAARDAEERAIRRDEEEAAEIEREQRRDRTFLAALTGLCANPDMTGPVEGIIRLANDIADTAVADDIKEGRC